ncbi:MAG: polymer-forming cytoskeletal protein [Treponema sp.]|jgi:cytoskeletal protein CcmA (bactofilin family)|nr:polymer-forming cytoskeletal protein [Treponema sp.]
MSRVKLEDFSINSILGPGSSVNGDIESAGFIRIDGSIRGNLSAKGRVVVGEKARMRGNISGTTVTVGGVVCGNILAGDRISILDTALVLGDIITRRIQADEGCLIHGKVTVCQNDEAWDKAVAEYRDAQGVRSALSGLTFIREAAPSKTPGGDDG